MAALSRLSLVGTLLSVTGCVVEVGPDDRCLNPAADFTAPEVDAVDEPLPTGFEAIDDSDVEPVVPADEDGAIVVAFDFPARVACGATATASITVENTGSLTWTRDSHKLGAVDDEDALFAGDPRVYLPAGLTVATGERHTFTFPLHADSSATAITVLSDWRMVHEGVRWFGDIADATVVVDACNEPEPPPARGLPNRNNVVRDVANERPDLLAASCVADGGNNDFLHAVVDRLRQEDSRWGYNWKRGNRGDMSQDVVDYHFGDGSPEDSVDVYIVDIIGGHCGENPQPAFNDVTQATRDGGTIGRWTSLDRF